MKALILLGVVVCVSAGCVQYDPSVYSAPSTSLYPVRPNAYGLGVNADEYGQPHTYRLQNGTPVDPIFQDGVKRNGYGLGVHQDQFGRPVYDSPAP